MKKTNRKHKTLTGEQLDHFDANQLKWSKMALKYLNLIGITSIVIFTIFNSVSHAEFNPLATATKAALIFGILTPLLVYYYAFKKTTSSFIHFVFFMSYLCYFIIDSIQQAGNPVTLYHNIIALHLLNLILYLSSGLSLKLNLAISVLTMALINIIFLNISETRNYPIHFFDINMWFIILTTASLLLKGYFRKLSLRSFLVDEQLKEANMTKYKLFSVVSHDLKNIIATQSGLTELLNGSHKDMNEEELESILNNLNKSSNDALNIFDELMIWIKSQLQLLKPQIHDIQTDNFFKHQIAFFNYQTDLKNITIDLCSQQIYHIKCDSNILSLAFRNILNNAIKFSSRNSTIAISTQASENGIAIAIKDEGKGMDAEKLKRIMSGIPIKSSEGSEGEKGTGLGLILTKDLLAQINGKLSIQSQPNKGTTVTLEVPALPQAS